MRTKVGSNEKKVVLLTLLSVATFIFLTIQAKAADHPSLVDPSKTKCETCHSDRLSGSVQHAVLAECTTCHEFDKVEGKTVVALMAEPPALCTMCHSDLEGAVEGTMAAPHYPVTDTCLSCHDPHSSDNPRMLVKASPALCFECHDAEELRTAHTVSVSRADCSSCHVPHGSEQKAMLVAGMTHAPFAEASCEACHRRGLATRAKKDSSQICFACHDADAFKAKVVHTAVKQGACLGCHDPHLSKNEHLMKFAGQELCFTCHQNIERKVAQKSVHAAVPDSCDTCHAPHTAENANLLPEPVPTLCATCHDLEDADLSSKHLGADMSTLGCTGCHDPHGSPEAPIIQSTSLHAPFNDRTCEICHEGSPTKLVENGSSALCYACHSDIEEVVSSAAVPHMAMEMAECRDCHSPHASKERKLKKEPGGGVCLTCHDDKAAEEGEFQHGAITMIGCESCHEPHGGTREAMISGDDMDQMCLGCHDRSKHKASEPGSDVVLLGRFTLPQVKASAMKAIALTNGTQNHPVVGHRALGALTEEEKSKLRSSVAFDGEFHCTTCHDPHKGSVRQLFVNGRGEVCSSCHAK